jgi:hypothetical protein
MLDHNNERSLAAMRIVTAHIAIAGAKPDLITTRVRIIEYCDYYVSGLRRIPLVAARVSTSSQAEPWHIVDATGRIGYKAAIRAEGSRNQIHDRFLAHHDQS